MQYLLLIFITFITTNKFDTKKIKEKRYYNVETQSNGLPFRKLKATTIYSMTGQIISETKACKDSNCCSKDEAFYLYTNKNEYWYQGDKLVLRVFYYCKIGRAHV